MNSEEQVAAVQIPLIGKINDFILEPLILLLIAAAVVTFTIAALNVISTSVDKKVEATKYLVWGIIGLFIMISAIGILNVVCSTIGCA
ncbi:MAG: hypothetical protein KBC48_02660 [Candidatus Pacebacteria bacterium]|nr:hypothetical protein [Candidatus Paceibacterota bacterium]